VPTPWSRRTILWAGRLAFALALLAPSPVAHAQQPEKTYRIGFLYTGTRIQREASPTVKGFRQGLNELGWVEGKNIVIEWREADGKPEQFPGLAADLVRLKVDLIVANGAPATHASRQATSTIPIVGIGLSDPVGQGLVASLVRPGGNVTGSATLFSELATKRLELLRETLPGLSRVAVVWNGANPGNVRQLEETKAAARSLKLRLQPVDVRGLDDLQRAFDVMTRTNPEALLIVADPLIITYQAQLVEFAAKRRLPAVHPFKESVEIGGLMAYALDLVDLNRRAATYVDKILRGAKPADLPIEQPTKFELVINMKTAQALGLKIPPSVLLRADQVIK